MKNPSVEAMSPEMKQLKTHSLCRNNRMSTDEDKSRRVAYVNCNPGATIERKTVIEHNCVQFHSIEDSINWIKLPQ